MKYFPVIVILSMLAACSKNSDETKNNGEKIETVVVHYNNGNVFCSGQHKAKKDDKPIRVGNWKFYHPNGKISDDMDYDENGVWMSRKYYSEDGKIVQTELENDNIYLATTYYKSGNIKEETLEKKVVEKDEDDSSEWTETVVKEFYPSGILKEQTEYLDGNPNGEKKIWDSTGVLLITVKYEDGIIISDHKSN